MSGYLSHLKQPEIADLQEKAGHKVTRAIYNASQRTDVDFAYLMEKAAAESSFDVEAKAKTSSASGLFQFIDRTWMDMVNKYGDKHGMGQYAKHIDAQGRVDDPEMRQRILDLRQDPEKAALMAAEFASENKRYLETHTNQDVGSTELYFAHFMGASGAAEFLNNLENNPDANAADVFPAAARANKNVFYDRNTGKKRSFEDIYQFFKQKFNDQPPSSAKEDTIETALNEEKKEFFKPTGSFDFPSYSSFKSSGGYNAFQKAFLPHSDEFDADVTELLLSSLVDVLGVHQSDFFLHKSSVVSNGDNLDDKKRNRRDQDILKN